MSGAATGPGGGALRRAQTVLDQLWSVAGRDRGDLLVGAVALPIYLATLAPTVTTGDSGDLITAAARLELAHPTGYPLYVLLGRFWLTLFWFLEPAPAMNLFSAVTAAAAGVLVSRLLRRLTGDRGVAWSAALLFCFSASFWSQATTARVYALNALLVVLVLGEILKPETVLRRLARGYFWLGLGLANHVSIAILLPLLLWRQFQLSRRARDWVRCGVWAVPGLSLYLYIPLVTWWKQLETWGSPATWESFTRYLLRLSYWDRGIVRAPGDLGGIALHYLHRSVVEITVIGVLMAGAAILFRRYRGRSEVWVGLYLFAANGLLMAAHGSYYDIFHWNRYMIPGWLGLVLMAGFGMAAMSAAARLRVGKGLLLVAPPVLALVLNWGHGNRAGNTLARDFAMAILEQADSQALILAEDDVLIFPLHYLHRVEGVRPDVELVLMGIDSLRDLRLEVDARPILFTHYRDPGVTNLRVVLEGPFYRLERTGVPGLPKPLPVLEAPSIPMELHEPLAVAPQAIEWRLPSFEAIREAWLLGFSDRTLVSHYWQLRGAALERVAPEEAVMAAERSLRLAPDVPLSRLGAEALLMRLEGRRANGVHGP